MRAPLLLLLLLTACGTAAPAYRPATLSPEALDLPPFERHTLDNGLRLVLIEDHTHPIVGLTAYVTTGGRTEDAAYAGALHFIEHLVFKGGTERFPPTTFRKRIAALGDESGGWTWDDEIQFGFEVPKANFGEALDVFAESLLELRWSHRWFEDERKVVLQEIEKVGEQPWHRLWNAWDELAFTRHPYRRAVIGDAATIEAQTIEDLERYYRERFTPNHLVLIVAGDFQPAAMLERIRARFGRYPRGPESFELPDVEEPEQTAPRRTRVVYPESRATRFIVGFRTPGAAHPDTAGLLLLAQLLSSPTEGIPAWLERKTQWVKSISVDHTFMVDHGSFTVEGEVDPEKAATVLSWLERYLTTLDQRGFSPEAVEEAARNLLTSRARSWEGYGDQAQGVGFWIERMGPEAARAATERILAHTPETLAALASRVLRPERWVEAVMTAADYPLPPARPVAERDPAPPVPDVAPLFEEADEPWSVGEPGEAGDVVHYELSSGLRLIVKPTPGRELLSAVAWVQGGQWTEPVDQAGVGELTARLLTAGSEHLDVAGWDRLLGHHGIAYANALTLGDRSNVHRNVHARDGATVAFDGVRAQWPLVLALMGEALLRPVFPDAEVTKQREVLLTEIDTLSEDNLEYVKQAFYAAAFAGHPYGRPTIGTRTSVTALTAEDVRRYHAQTFTPDRMVVAVVGDVVPDEVAAMIARHWAGGPLQRAGPLELTPVPHPKRSPPLKTLELGKDQWCVNIGAPTVPAAHPDAAALELVMAIARGRHFYKYVYERGVSYRSWIKLWPQWAASAWILENDVARSSFQETLNEMARDLGSYVGGAFGQADVDVARTRLLNTAILTAQRGQQVAFELARGAALGLGWNAPATRLAQLRAVTLRDVRRLAFEAFASPRHRVILK